ncbi:MAG TPA: methionyl-tRNA formyltransferase [Candidatus Saccharimonadales bacterium]|nr:methionyl-tRNA formyltransferase [Candidatus Saccharimonadales bacterium]
MKIAFFGTPTFAQIVLEKLIASQYKPELVITAHDAKAGRGRQIKSSPVKQSAEKNNIEVITPTNLKDVNNLDFELAILVAYGKILPQNILDIPKYGFINVHPSLLPKYRGPSPIQSAILNGERTTGVSIMLLDQEVDHGPVLSQKEIEIEKSDTHDSLAQKLANVGADLLLETLPPYLDGSQKPKEQTHQEATVTEHITKQDGYFDIENPPKKEDLDRMIRAYFRWPTAWTKIHGRVVKFLPEGKIQPEGKKPMKLKEFLNGYQQFKDQIEKLF